MRIITYPIVRTLTGRHIVLRNQFAIVPYVVVGVLAFALDRLLEPLAVLAGVIWHKVQNKLDTGRIRGLEQILQILHRSERRVDCVEIGNIVAEIGHRRLEHRTQPCAGDAHLLQVRQLLNNAANVADTVAITVVERARVDLVEGGRLVPVLWRVVPWLDDSIAIYRGHAQSGNHRQCESHVDCCVRCFGGGLQLTNN